MDRREQADTPNRIVYARHRYGPCTEAAYTGSMATCTTLQTTLRVLHSNRLHVNLYYIYQPPKGSTFASADSGLARIDRRHALALMSILVSMLLLII